MPRLRFFITITLRLVSCGGAPAVTAAEVAEKLTAAGARTFTTT
jgi:hypothetical protein